MNIRTLIKLLYFALVVIKAYGQETEHTRLFETRSNIAAYPCDILGERVYKDVKKFERAPYQARFAVVRVLKDQSVVVRFLTWYVKTPRSATENQSSSSTPPESTTTVSPSASSDDQARAYRINFNEPLTLSPDDLSINPSIKPYHIYGNKFIINRFFIIAKSDLDSNCVKIFSTWIKSAVFTLGIVTMPIKLRVGPNFDFQGNLSLGTTAGAKVRVSKYSHNYLNLLLGLSLSTVSLDSFSTGGKIKGQPLTNIGVFSPSVGAVFEFGKAQVGAFYGWDFLNKSTQVKYDWIYNQKPWISIGFGFSIFSVDSKASSNLNFKQTIPTGPPTPDS